MEVVATQSAPKEKKSTFQFVQNCCANKNNKKKMTD